MAKRFSHSARAAAIAVILLVALQPVIAAFAQADPVPANIDRFMLALGCQESGNRYDVTNKRSGAMGRYQIMPFNWPVWAKRYLGDAKAPPNPANQERVARGKFESLYHWNGDWALVAHWWFSGSKERNPSLWSAASTRYVRNVMALFNRPVVNGQLQLPAACLRVPRATGGAAAPATAGSPTGPGTPRAAAAPAVAKRLTTGHLNVRSAPGYEKTRVAWITKGTTVAVEATGRDARGKPWLRVRVAGGPTGWIAAWFTKAAP